MKTFRILTNITLAAIIGLSPLTSNAQGIIVHKKNGTSIRLPYEELDCIKSFQKNESSDEDNNDNANLNYPIQNKIPGTYRIFEVNGVQFRMIDVRGGSFNMGSADDTNTKPVHKVTLSDYQIGETEVTQELWTAVMDDNPSSFLGAGDLPVNRLNWEDCQSFIEKLNSLTGQNFRLPTEAEWEYAAKGGNKSKGYIYSGSNDHTSIGWYKVNSLNTVLDYTSGDYLEILCTHPVGTKQANELGICDMSGNLIEWCQDYYGNYKVADQIDPITTTVYKENGLKYRVARGGSYMNDASAGKTTTRFKLTEGGRTQAQGLRLAHSSNK